MDEIVVAAGEIAFRPLDLDDACARIGKPARTHRRRHRLLEGNDEKAGEGEGHGGIHAGGWLWVVDRARCEPRTHNDLKAAQQAAYAIEKRVSQVTPFSKSDGRTAK